MGKKKNKNRCIRDLGIIYLHNKKILKIMETPNYVAPTSSKTRAVDSWVRDEAQKLIDKKKASLSTGQKDKLGLISQKLKALALLSENLVIPNHRCTICNGKGYIQVRKGKGSNGKWGWEQEACYCTWRKVKPTDVTDLKYIEREPEKPNEPVAESKGKGPKKQTTPSGSPKSPRKRPAKV